MLNQTLKKKHHNQFKSYSNSFMVLIEFAPNIKAHRIKAMSASIMDKNAIAHATIDLI